MIKIYETLKENEFRLMDLDTGPSRNVYILYKKYFGKSPRKKYLSKEYVSEYCKKHNLRWKGHLCDIAYLIITLEELMELRSYVLIYCENTHFNSYINNKYAMLMSIDEAFNIVKDILNSDKI